MPLRSRAAWRASNGRRTASGAPRSPLGGAVRVEGHTYHLMVSGPTSRRQARAGHVASSTCGKPAWRRRGRSESYPGIYLRRWRRSVFRKRWGVLTTATALATDTGTSATSNLKNLRMSTLQLGSIFEQGERRSVHEIPLPGFWRMRHLWPSADSQMSKALCENLRMSTDPVRRAPV